jgi:hypothetical protein
MELKIVCLWAQYQYSSGEEYIGISIVLDLSSQRTEQTVVATKPRPTPWLLQSLYILTNTYY